MERGGGGGGGGGAKIIFTMSDFRMKINAFFDSDIVP